MAFKGESKDYLLILREGDRYEENQYYVFQKRNRRIKKIGIFPESITGFLTNNWWGESSTIIGDYLYLVGVRYWNKKYPDIPAKIIITKIDLSNIEKLPTVTIEEVLAK